MLTDTISGKCPCCGYDKLLQRYGSFGYLQLDGCSNCGFGYSSNHHDDPDFGIKAWIDHAKYLIAMSEFESDELYQKRIDELNLLSDEEVRRLAFDFCENSERYDDVEYTVFKYTEEDVLNHKKLNLEVFKEII